MSLLQTIATDGASPVPRWRQAVTFMVKHPVQAAKLLNGYRWSERTVILLVMQSLDNSITTYTKRGLFGRRKYTSKQGHGEPNPSFIPAGHEANERTADRIGGIAGGTWGEIFDIPLTAHFIGGVPIGATAEEGVIDPYHRVFGYPGLSRRRRRGDHGQPRREPVADDHGPGRAGVLVLAEQGRGGPAAGAGRVVRPAGAGGAEEPGRSRPKRPAALRRSSDSGP